MAYCCFRSAKICFWLLYCVVSCLIFASTPVAESDHLPMPAVAFLNSAFARLISRRASCMPFLRSAMSSFQLTVLSFSLAIAHTPKRSCHLLPVGVYVNSPLSHTECYHVAQLGPCCRSRVTFFHLAGAPIAIPRPFARAARQKA